MDIHRDEIDVDAIPGTVHLLDLDHNLVNLRHASDQEEIVLIPTPSDDPDDPLNWSPRRKALSTACINIYTLVVGLAGSVVYSVLIPLSTATGLTVSDLNAGTGYLFLLAGWGLIFWLPFALQYGKRPTYLTSVLGTLAVTVWSPYAGANGMWIAKNILGGFFAAPIEALPELSVTDVFFSHQRGTYMGLYAFFLAGSNYFAPVICGFINDYQVDGWKWVFYWPAIFLAVAFIFLFFFMEETNYDRKTAAINEQSDMKSRNSIAPDSGNEKSMKLTTVLEAPEVISEDNASQIFRKKTFWQKLALKDTSKPNLMLYRLIVTMRFLSWPVVFYAGFSYGSYLIWFNVLNATASLLLSAPPYNFSSSMVGLSYMACCIGTIAGAFCTGRLSDWLTIRLVRRNQGIMEPEQRLWPFTVCVILVPASLILWGVGAAHEIHWFGLICAMFLLSFSSTAGITLSVNYMIDTYQELSGEAIGTVIIVRNTMSFAIGYAITPWIDGMGIQNCFICAAFIGMAACAVFFVMIVWGKQFRARSKSQYWALVQESKKKGISP